MATEHKVTCDACGNDLTCTSNMEDWRLSLRNVALSAYGNAAVTCMAVYPAIQEDADFCGINCLREWLDKHYPADRRHHGGKAGADWQRKERAKKDAGEPSPTT